MKIITSCPLGHKCEKVISSDGVPVLERCVKYVAIKTRDELTQEDREEFKCSDVWQLDIAIMNNRLSGNIVSAVDEVRVQQTKRQDVALQIAGGQFLENDIMKSLNEESNQSN